MILFGYNENHLDILFYLIFSLSKSTQMILSHDLFQNQILPPIFNVQCIYYLGEKLGIMYYNVSEVKKKK